MTNNEIHPGYSVRQNGGPWFYVIDHCGVGRNRKLELSNGMMIDAAYLEDRIGHGVEVKKGSA